MAAKLKKGNRVIILAGKDKGRTGEILAIYPKKRKAIVSEINMAIRHRKQSQTEEGGRVPVPMPIDISNLALLDSNNKPTRVGFRMEGDKKVRYAKTTGETV